MIDTIRAWSTSAVQRPGDDWAEERHSQWAGDVGKPKFTHNTPLAQMTLSECYGRGRFEVQASIPKVLYGHNIKVLGLDEHQEACARLFAHVARAAPRCALPPPAAWSLTRVDWCHSWQVESPHAYIAEVDRLIVGAKAHRKTHIIENRHGGSTVAWGPRVGAGRRKSMTKRRKPAICLTATR